MVPAGGSKPLDYDGDNRRFVIEDWLTRLNAPDDVYQVIRWAYGYDGELDSWEMRSDGSTIVPDRSMNGLLKEPPGVGHDYLNRVAYHITPDDHEWTCAATNRWYRRAMAVYGYHPLRRWVRWIGLTVSGWMPGRLSWWR